MLLVGGGMFYWFQYRPAQIRHDCSWIHVQRDEVPAIPPDPTVCNQTTTVGGLDLTPFPSKKCSGSPGKASEDYWTAADEDEYKFCLHDKGL